jgi:uncharacterized SAM-binding protein YcdF (DUF218 family)
LRAATDEQLKNGKRRLFVLVVALIFCAVYFATTEAGSSLALATLDHRGAYRGHGGTERAIVLLTGGRTWRVPKAAEMQRTTGLPLVVAGRNAGHYLKMLQQQGAQSLWPERNSTNTEQNAAFSTCLVLQNGLQPVFIVTDAAHMRRAVGWFKFYGLSVTPVVSGPPYPGASANPLLPSELGWARTKTVIHEWLGLVKFWLSTMRGRRLQCPGEESLPQVGS